MSFINSRPQESYFNPITDTPSVTKVQLVDGQSFGSDRFLEDVEETAPPVGKFDDGGAGYKEVNDGNLLGLPAFKRSVRVHGLSSKNMTGPALEKVGLDGASSAISIFPVDLTPGEDLKLVGTASNADNYIAITMSEITEKSAL